ncbi:alpha-(1,3)-fucosyltransferase 10-like [Clytia hemisphaerica]|uniref:Fucosyltransferase n=1 Tax=Clytia hemisphaerica TaxID=252671 RepID=A0A7M5WWS6_9CNID
MRWIMRLKLKYLLLIIVLAFVSLLTVLQLLHGGEDQVEFLDAGEGHGEGEEHGGGSNHIPDYILEEEALPPADTLEELDNGNWHDFAVDRVRRPVIGAKEQAEKEDLPFIVWWTPFTGETGRIKKCFVGDCYFSQDRELMTHPKTKAFLFYGTDFSVKDLPLPKKRHHEWGLTHEESPKNNAIFYHEEGMNVFNHTCTFKQQSSYPISTQYIRSMKYLLKPLTYTTAEREEFKRSEGLAAVAYVQSGCNPPSDRDAYVKELMKYIKIDSYGKCLHNKDLPKVLLDPLTMFDKAYLKFFEKYKFIISFENARCNDYMTEKIFRTIHMGSVPIYLGASNLREWLPDPKSVIMVEDFKSPKDLAEHIKYLDENSSEYEKLLEYKTKGNDNKKLEKVLEERQWGVDTGRKMNMVTGFECHVCDQIHRNRNRQKAGEPILQYRATLEHYGCPKPTQFPFPDVPGSQDWERKNWLWDYDGGKEQAIKMKRKMGS